MSRWFGDSDIGRRFGVQIVHVLPAAEREVFTKLK